MTIITTSVCGSSTYYCLESRGTRYSLRFHLGEWELYSKRMALGSSSMGSYRQFLTLEDVERQIKAFRGISTLIGNGNPVAGQH